MNSHGGNIRAYCEKYGLKSKNIVDFSANINPIGLTKNVRDTIVKNISSIIHYPDTDCKNLIEALAKNLNLNSKNILVGNGSTEIIYLISNAISPRKTLICIPTFSEYEISAKNTGSEIVYIKTVKENFFTLNIEDILENIPKVDLIFLCNPNNPTGNLISKNDILKIVNKCEKQKTYIAIDEVFIDFVDNPEVFSSAVLAPSKNYLIVIKSLTKIFGLPGIRLGYCIANDKVINKLKKFQYPWSVNSLAQKLAEKIIKDRDFIESSKKLIKKEREFIYDKLKEIKFIKPYPSVTNFILCELKDTKLTSTLLAEKLGKKGIFIRDCSNFKGLNNKFFRIAVRTRKENIRLIKNIKEIFK